MNIVLDCRSVTIVSRDLDWANRLFDDNGNEYYIPLSHHIPELPFEATVNSRNIVKEIWLSDVTLGSHPSLAINWEELVAF